MHSTHWNGMQELTIFCDWTIFVQHWWVIQFRVTNVRTCKLNFFRCVWNSSEFFPMILPNNNDKWKNQRSNTESHSDISRKVSLRFLMFSLEYQAQFTSLLLRIYARMFRHLENRLIKNRLRQLWGTCVDQVSISRVHMWWIVWCRNRESPKTLKLNKLPSK